MNKTKIEWTESTWNPITGCSKISDGCLNCYAERMAKRLKAMGNKRYKNGFEVTIHEDLFEQPLQYSKARMIFVSSMSDIFHEKVAEEHILKIFNTMNLAQQHTFQVLTKRADRIADINKKVNWTDNIWMGVSVEDKKTMSRIDCLRNSDARINFISFEPLLEDVGEINLNNIDWVIVGGESGPGARPMDKEWVINIKKQCDNANIKFFFKQWGGVRKKEKGNLLDGKQYFEMPE